MITLEQALLDTTGLSAADLERAASRRSEMGGRLGTALLELGLLGEKELAPALTAHSGLPAATAADLQNIPDSVLALLSREQAGAYGVVPFASAPGRIDLAVAAALDVEKADELAFLLGRRVRFFITNEVRVAQALQRHYNQAQPARLLNLADRLERGLGPSRDLASEPAGASSAAVQPGTFGDYGAGGGRRREEGAQSFTRRITPTKPREERRTVALTEEERRAIFGPAPEPEATADEDLLQVPASDLARLSHALQTAASPTAVGEAFLVYLGSLFETVVLLRPEGELFCGWLAHGSGLEKDRLRQLITGPGLANEWRELVGTAEAAQTVIGPSAAAIGFDAALGVNEGGAISLIPVRVQERVVCLAACAPGREFSGSDSELLGNASLRTGLALQSWILRQKTLSKTPS